MGKKTACLGAGICMLLSACVLFYFICLHIESYRLIDAIVPLITTHNVKDNYRNQNEWFGIEQKHTRH